MVRGPRCDRHRGLRAYDRLSARTALDGRGVDERDRGGLLFAAGLLGPVGPLAMAAVLLTAILSVHRGKGFFAQRGGPELPFVYLVPAVAVAIGGPGRLSLNSLFGIALPEPVTGIVAAIVVVLGIVTAFASRRPRMDTMMAHSA